jgi:hypothetical protein
VLSLSRLVCEQSAPKNTPSFLLSNGMRFIDRNRWPILITFADDWQGHVGTIYRAAGWIECGRTKPNPTYTLNGRRAVRFYEVERRYAHSNPQSINAKINGSLVLIHFAHISRAAFRRSAYARIVIHDGVEWRDYIGRRVAVSNAKAVKAGMLCGITRKYSEVNSVRPK